MRIATSLFVFYLTILPAAADSLCGRTVSLEDLEGLYTFKLGMSWIPTREGLIAPQALQQTESATLRVGTNVKYFGDHLVFETESSGPFNSIPLRIVSVNEPGWTLFKDSPHITFADQDLPEGIGCPANALPRLYVKAGPVDLAGGGAVSFDYRLYVHRLTENGAEIFGELRWWTGADIGPFQSRVVFLNPL